MIVGALALALYNFGPLLVTTGCIPHCLLMILVTFRLQCSQTGRALRRGYSLSLNFCFRPRLPAPSGPSNPARPARSVPAGAEFHSKSRHGCRKLSKPQNIAKTCEPDSMKS